MLASLFPSGILGNSAERHTALLLSGMPCCGCRHLLSWSVINDSTGVELALSVCQSLGQTCRTHSLISCAKPSHNIGVFMWGGSLFLVPFCIRELR